MTDHPDLSATKKALRAHAIAVRRAAFRDAAGQRLAAFADRLPPGEVVAGYWPMGDEIDPRPLMAELARRGRNLALPVVAARGQALTFRAWSPGDRLEPGPHGTAHPIAGAAERIPDLLLVPLLAFDRAGFRLGYGGGYYDRTLETLRARAQVKAIGLAFAAQEVAIIPRDGHDQRLDGILTEDGLIMPVTL